MSLADPAEAAPKAAPLPAPTRHPRPLWQRGVAALVPIALVGALAVKLVDHPDAAMAAPRLRL